MNETLIIFCKLFIMFFFFISCKEKKTNSIPIIEIEKNIGNFNPFKLSDLDCELEYVVLETTPDAMLLDIRFVDISDDHIVVSDRDKCLLFERSGNSISKIGRKGRGPGENRSFPQVKIFNDKIFLPDGITNEINIYNTKGEFLNSVQSPGGFCMLSNSWMPLNDSSYLLHNPNYTGNEKYRIALINNKGEILQKYENTTFFTSNLGHHCPYDRHSYFYKYEGIFYFKQLFNDTIWQIKNDQLIPVYITNLGQYGFSFDYKALPNPLYFEIISELILFRNVFGARESIFFIMYFQKNYPLHFHRIYTDSDGVEQIGHYPIIGLYNKLNDEFFLVAPSNIDDQLEPTGFENDIDGGINFMPKYAVNDTLMVGWFEAYQLKMYVASETFKNSTPKYPEKKKELEALAASLDENDNPVLMLVKLKE